MEWIFKLAAHPLRLEIMRILDDGETRSPKQLAELCAASLATVSYHVRILADAGVIVLDHEQPVRGAVAHYYRAVSEVGTFVEALDRLTQAIGASFERARP